MYFDSMICRKCGDFAISEKTKYCRPCQARRMKKYNNDKSTNDRFIVDERWCSKAKELNGRIMKKYADKWKVTR